MQYIALLRGINVSGRNKVPMKELESVCHQLNWKDVKTHLQTGNIIFTAEDVKQQLEQNLEKAIEEHFGFHIPVIICRSSALITLVEQTPFIEQVAESSSKVLLYLTKKAIEKNALEYLQERAKAEEQVFIQEKSIWIFFPNGVGSSKLTPSVIDRAVGSTATGRNWNTVTKIQNICNK